MNATRPAIVVCFSGLDPTGGAGISADIEAITDAELICHGKLLEDIEQALKGSANIIQYRDKKPDPVRHLTQASAIQNLCQQYGGPLLINDDIDLAVQCRADGVHLGKNDASIDCARQKLGKKAIIEITCQDSMALALNAQQQGVAFGRLFPSLTKPQAPPAPLELLELARPQLHVPMVAIDGITVDNARQVIQRGADAIAVIHHLFSTDNIEQRAHQLSSEFHSI